MNKLPSLRTCCQRDGNGRFGNFTKNRKSNRRHPADRVGIDHADIAAAMFGDVFAIAQIGEEKGEWYSAIYIRKPPYPKRYCQFRNFHHAHTLSLLEQIRCTGSIGSHMSLGPAPLMLYVSSI